MLPNMFKKEENYEFKKGIKRQEYLLCKVSSSRAVKKGSLLSNDDSEIGYSGFKDPRIRSEE